MMNRISRRYFFGKAATGALGLSAAPGVCIAGASNANESKLPIIDEADICVSGGSKGQRNIEERRFRHYLTIFESFGPRRNKTTASKSLSTNFHEFYTLYDLYE